MEKRPVNILIIEDDPDDFIYISTKLKSSKTVDYNIYHSESISQTIEKQFQTVDLVLCDLNLNDYFGKDTIEIVSELYKNTPVIVVSGVKDESIVEFSSKSNIEDYLNKEELSSLNLDKKIVYVIDKFSAAKIKKLESEMTLIKLLTSETAHQLNNSACILSLLEAEFPDVDKKIISRIFGVSEKIKLHTSNLLAISEESEIFRQVISVNTLSEKFNIRLFREKEILDKNLDIDLEKFVNAINFFIDENEIKTGIMASLGDKLVIEFQGEKLEKIHNAEEENLFSLLVLRGIVNQHNGRISHEGEKLKVLLPFSKDEIGAKLAKKYNISRVLLVEDEEEIKEILTEILSNSGYTVFNASNGKEALEVLDRETVDIIISDVMMPKMSGIDLYHKIRSEKKIPFVFMSGYSGGRLLNDKNSFEEIYFLQKPFNPEAIIAQLKSISS